MSKGNTLGRLEPGSARWRYHQVRLAGRCVRCGAVREPPREHHSLCAGCRRHDAAESRDRTAQRRAAGLCTRCGTAPPVAGGRQCAACRRRTRRRVHALRRRARAT